MSKNKTAETDSSSTSLHDFVIPQKVDAFIEAYLPADEDGEFVEYFTDARLREFFKAWPCSLGDPLSEYLNMLSKHNFRMRVTLTGEPAIMAILK